MDITYRRGTLHDTRAVFSVLVQTSNDQDRRTGIPESENIWADPVLVAGVWERWHSLYEFLASTAEQFWVAKNEEQIIGYARSLLKDGVRELTEFYVLPGFQSVGIGRELLARAFPANGARRRVIMATTDIRAQARYLKSGVYPRFVIQYFFRKPEPIIVKTDLVFKSALATPETLTVIRAIDKVMLDFERDDDHQFLLNDRKAYLYYRGEQVVGYGYIGKGTGPIALLYASDYPAVLAHAENDAVERGDEEFGMNVPLINRTAVDYLLARQFQWEDSVGLFMSDEPFGKFENYIICYPDFFM